MKLPRVRFTIRTMVVAVAVVAFAIWGGIAGVRTSRHNREVEAFHARDEARARSKLNSLIRSQQTIEKSIDALVAKDRNAAKRDYLRPQLELRDKILEDVRRQKRVVGRIARLRRAYHRAALFPWLSTEPDPPSPEPE